MMPLHYMRDASLFIVYDIFKRHKNNVLQVLIDLAFIG